MTDRPDAPGFVPGPVTPSDAPERETPPTPPTPEPPKPEETIVAKVKVNVPGSPIHGETVEVLKQVAGAGDCWHARVASGPFKGDTTTVYPHQCESLTDTAD